jgi:hypothetical protein
MAALLAMIRRSYLLSVGAQSIDRQVLKNNVVALAKAAKVFRIPTTITTVETESFSGNTYPELLAVFPENKILERTSMNSCDDQTRFLPPSRCHSQFGARTFVAVMICGRDYTGLVSLWLDNRPNPMRPEVTHEALPDVNRCRNTGRGHLRLDRCAVAGTTSHRPRRPAWQIPPLVIVDTCSRSPRCTRGCIRCGRTCSVICRVEAGRPTHHWPGHKATTARNGHKVQQSAGRLSSAACNAVVSKPCSRRWRRAAIVRTLAPSSAMTTQRHGQASCRSRISRASGVRSGARAGPCDQSKVKMENFRFACRSLPLISESILCPCCHEIGSLIRRQLQGFTRLK